mmetsp:Transcript_22854/g.54147  ORF Transcript_22854/g.54147 Transcript_22854/m.54147 type:complete len:106 (-) Transcript_22854:179-496(-)
MHICSLQVRNIELMGHGPGSPSAPWEAISREARCNVNLCCSKNSHMSHDSAGQGSRGPQRIHEWHEHNKDPRVLLYFAIRSSMYNQQVKNLFAQVVVERRIVRYD